MLVRRLFEKAFQRKNKFPLKVLVLGHTGMLGNMVNKYLSSKYEVITTNLRAEDYAFDQLIKNFEGDYIINCIGRIPQKWKHWIDTEPGMTINTNLPIKLNKNAKCRVIHPSSDCEENGIDEYARSKLYATNYILSEGQRTKIIKCSIIGPELETCDSLFSWVLNQKKDINGYTNQMWNGITSLEWAKRAEDIMIHWRKYDKMNVFRTVRISKFYLIHQIVSIFNLNINVIPFELDNEIDRSLHGGKYIGQIEDQLKEMFDIS